MPKNYRAELTGVFGDPVDGNPTGAMEEAGYAALGLDFRYITARVTPEDFEDAMRALRALHFRGVNLTMPHKITVLPHLDELSEAAAIIGAVNTVVVREDGTLFGENTDGKGFVEALRAAGETLEGRRDTLFLAACAERGARTLDGLDMLAHQGARNFTLWTGVDAPLDVLEAALAREFEEQ
ncbi:shikimate dehydrogenase family protein [Actinomyces culturomici]|uniref:shikimate dehydrogenase family protein n=1 Tax=Actinomyces culturomici TaxID=1926276 RepID=UPI000E1FD469|nr:hypothetical protein [Actinomyces culturomici]